MIAGITEECPNREGSGSPTCNEYGTFCDGWDHVTVYEPDSKEAEVNRLRSALIEVSELEPSVETADVIVKLIQKLANKETSDE